MISIKKSKEILIPSKTFLLGEYAALENGLAILAATSPCFQLQLNQESLAFVHPESPAGRYRQILTSSASLPCLSRYHLHDPHNAAGGFGASTAEFIAVYLAAHANDPDKNIDVHDWQQLRKDYQRATQSDHTYCASGYDLLAQYTGMITVISNDTQKIESVDWPFEELSFIICKTPNKTATHDILKTMNQLDVSTMNVTTQMAMDALASHDQNQWLECIQEYAQILDVHQLTCDQTKKLLSLLEHHDGVLAAKGCGALGADVIAVFCEKKNKEAVIQDCKKIGLLVTADETQLHAGVATQIGRH